MKDLETFSFIILIFKNSNISELIDVILLN